MKAENKKYQIALSLVGGVSDIIAKKLLVHFVTAKAVSYVNKEITR